MTRKEIALDLAAFVDSAAARTLGLRADAVRRIAEAFLTVAYDELQKKPRLFDGEDTQAAVARALPAHFGRRDPLAADVPAVLGAFFDHLDESQVVTQSFEIRRALEPALERFAATVDEGSMAHQSTRRPDTVVHRADKTGRNEPCFCGSGKKFKKCHGRGA